MSQDWYDESKLNPWDINGELVQFTTLTGIAQTLPTRRRKMPFYTLNMAQGDDRSLRVYVKDPNLDIIDLSGAVGQFFLRTAQKGGAAVFDKATNVTGEGQIGAADEGEMFFFIEPSDTSSLDARQYWWMIRVTLSNGKTYSIANGVINLQEAYS